MNIFFALHVVMPEADFNDMLHQLIDVKAHIIVVLFENDNNWDRGGVDKMRFFQTRPMVSTMMRSSKSCLKRNSSSILENVAIGYWS